MALPKIGLPTGEVEVGGVTVTFRSLSRTESLKVSTQYRGKADDAENFIIAKGCGVTEEEAAEWRNSGSAKEVGELVDAIIYLSGLADIPEDKDEDMRFPVMGEDETDEDAPKD